MSYILPASVILLTCLSLFAAVSILICSFMDRGFVSVSVTGITCRLIFTQSGYVLIVVGKPDVPPPHDLLPYPTRQTLCSTAAITCAFVLWLGAFAAMVLVARKGQIGLGLNVMMIPFPPQYALSQGVQFMTTPVEFALLGDLAVRTTTLQRKLVHDKFWFVLFSALEDCMNLKILPDGFPGDYKDPFYLAALMNCACIPVGGIQNRRGATIQEWATCLMRGYS